MVEIIIKGIFSKTPRMMPKIQAILLYYHTFDKKSRVFRDFCLCYNTSYMRVGR